MTMLIIFQYCTRGSSVHNFLFAFVIFANILLKFTDRTQFVFSIGILGFLGSNIYCWAIFFTKYTVIWSTLPAIEFLLSLLVLSTGFYAGEHLFTKFQGLIPFGGIQQRWHDLVGSTMVYAILVISFATNILLVLSFVGFRLKECTCPR